MLQESELRTSNVAWVNDPVGGVSSVVECELSEVLQLILAGENFQTKAHSIQSVESVGLQRPPNPWRAHARVGVHTWRTQKMKPPMMDRRRQGE